MCVSLLKGEARTAVRTAVRIVTSELQLDTVGMGVSIRIKLLLLN